MKTRRKIVILGAGNVGATIAYTLTMSAMASEIVLIDVNEDKAKGEAMDIIQGTAFCAPTDVYAGHYPDAADADIVIVTVGMARKTGQSRRDLAQTNVNIVKMVMPEIMKWAPNAVYVVVSNPVDALTYTIAKTSGLPESQVIGSGTMLDSTRLRARLAEHMHLNLKNVHAYVFGEHGDSSVIPWSLATIGGMQMEQYCDNICEKQNHCGKSELKEIEDDVRMAGGRVIALKGATYYAIALSVNRICECILRDTNSILTVSGLLHGEYGIEDVCLSIPFVVGRQGIERSVPPPMKEEEVRLLQKSAEQLKALIAELDI